MVNGCCGEFLLSKRYAHIRNRAGLFGMKQDIDDGFEGRTTGTHQKAYAETGGQEPEGKQQYDTYPRRGKSLHGARTALKAEPPELPPGPMMISVSVSSTP